MNSTRRLVLSVAFLLCVMCECVPAVKIDCQNPPQLVDPSLCCQDGGRDDNTEKCAKRLGILKDGQTASTPAAQPTMETATCLAECILTEARYMQQPEQLHFETIRSDLQQRYANDTAYVEAMYSAFQRCQPSAQRKLAAYRQVPLGNAALQRGCSPFAGMLLGCTYMDYFKNCPAHRWTENEQCAIAKQFVTQCGLGA